LPIREQSHEESQGEQAMTTDTSAMAERWDRFRQILVLVLSLAPPITTILAFATGTTFEEATRSDGGKPLIEPAGYAFIVWTLIYGGSVAYGIFQALPSQAGNELFRRIGFFTASAFVGTSVWLLMARFGWIWLTVVCIVWMLASLAPAFVWLVSYDSSLTLAERCLVVFPLSVFTAWVTVATFANTAAAVKDSGWADVGLSEQSWTVLMLAAAGLVACGATLFSRGNAGYALTVLWALAAIVVANLHPGQSTPVAVTAGLVGGAVALVLHYARHASPASS
jgi:translocator protein